MDFERGLSIGVATALVLNSTSYGLPLTLTWTRRPWRAPTSTSYSLSLIANLCLANRVAPVARAPDSGRRRPPFMHKPRAKRNRKAGLERRLASDARRRRAPFSGRR